MIVVDASVAVKWLIPEAGSEQAIELLKGDVLAAPDLIRIEVASAVTRRARVGEMEAAEAESLCESWLTWLGRGALTLFPTDPDLPDAVRFALAIRHPLADCLYLALAARWQTELLTADRRFFERARGAYPVRLLVN
jgi:predicted nucleic acid-binding protein